MAAISAAILMVLATAAGRRSRTDTGRGKHGFHVRRQAPARDATQARAHHLDADHQRVGENHGPQHAEAELRAGLRIGRDAARIVVRGARDETRAQLLHPRIFRNAFQQIDHRQTPQRGMSQAGAGVEIGVSNSRLPLAGWRVGGPSALSGQCSGCRECSTDFHSYDYSRGLPV